MNTYVRTFGRLTFEAFLCFVLFHFSERATESTMRALPFDFIFLHLFFSFPTLRHRSLQSAPVEWKWKGNYTICKYGHFAFQWIKRVVDVTMNIMNLLIRIEFRAQYWMFIPPTNSWIVQLECWFYSILSHNWQRTILLLILFKFRLMRWME